MPSPLAITLHASGVETTSGIGAAIDLTDRTLVQLVLEATAVSGTSPSLVVSIETSLTGLDWKLLGSFDPITVSAAKKLNVPSSAKFIRARWVITGTTPSFTFVVSGVANQLYCLPEDVTRFGLPGPALEGVSVAVIADACLAASDEAAGYLAGGFTLPLSGWSLDLRKHVACIAAYDLMRFRGYDPDSGKDELLQRGYDQAITWLNRIANGKLRPVGMLDTTPLVAEVEVYVDSVSERGWRR